MTKKLACACDGVCVCVCVCVGGGGGGGIMQFMLGAPNTLAFLFL